MITQKALSDILKPLVAAGVYKDEQRALQGIVADYVQRKIDAYSDVILRMEQKYDRISSHFRWISSAGRQLEKRMTGWSGRLR